MEAQGIPDRMSPASARTTNLPTVNTMDDVAKFLLENFSDPAFEYSFWLTPGELCDIAEHYSGSLALTIPYMEYTPHFADRAVQLGLHSTKGLSDDKVSEGYFKGFTLLGILVFNDVQNPKFALLDSGMVPEALDVERAFDVRGRYAMNFMSLSGGVWSDEDTLTADELWPRLWRYCSEVGAPIDVAT